MQLVDREEFQRARRLMDEWPLRRADKHVGEQNVRRVGEDTAARFVPVLSGIAGEG